MVVVWTDYARESAAYILEFVCKCWGDPMAMTVSRANPQKLKRLLSSLSKKIL